MSEMSGMSGSSGGMMAMEPVARLPIPHGATVRLATGGYHLMLVGLHRDLKAGMTFPVTFRFANAGLVRTTATVHPF
jgi:copper(I)-binding protein